LGTLSWVLIKDYKKFFENKVGNYNNRKHPRKEYFYLFFYKAINYTLFIVLPYFFIDYAWYHILAGFILMHFVAGFYLAIVFMLAHIVEKTHFPLPDETGSLENTWAIHQLYTTANFSRKTISGPMMTGGLNQQVEHHLFPNVCSTHYPALGELVKQTAEEFGHPYLEYDTFGEAVKSHVAFLKNIGRIENYKPGHKPKMAAA
jgi:linoleoyl-CoA desaturase